MPNSGETGGPGDNLTEEGISSVKKGFPGGRGRVRSLKESSYCQKPFRQKKRDGSEGTPPRQTANTALKTV